MAIEVKVVRASFARQGRSPNEFGYSQASALIDLGFPYVALMHIVISDASPEDAWREVLVARLEEEDRITMLGARLADTLPTDLVYRSFGRLEANATRNELGLVAAYLDERAGGGRRWMPLARRAVFNPAFNPTLYRAIANYYEAHSKRFLETPRFDSP
jgi:hypothetical protein